jgi:histone deacetylase complex regulatory component SIN3
MEVEGGLGGAAGGVSTTTASATRIAGAGAGAGAAGAKPVGTAMPKTQQQQHAITYVTTIRNRFASEPEMYRSFLKILDTYKRGQKGIKDVLEQVSLLFADHPDLLMEFTYFLPDAVQEQAKGT